ncbi:hypothetical protein EDC04DRAFT_345148 [Pisolithus marmoratus]|nr:hypothetical protein EDC04DRAFT_345148 [Pisolithus marmoratus]
MSGSLQDSYAKHLPCAKYGYPLWMPEPMGTLPEDYLERGLQIGDVGTVDREGWFDVLFNICKGSNNALHVCRGVPKNFQPVQPVKDADVRCSDNAISAGAIHSSGITRHLQPDNLSRLFDYEFDLSTRAGAILILPSGAESQQLSPPEQFLEVARVNALDWYKFAKACYKGHLDRSLYLITGFYKARSWSLGSFEKSTGDIGKILARRHPDNPNVYKLESSCRADLRHSSVADVSGSVNQAVFITGFKITVRSWLPDPVVSPILESETLSILACMFKVCLSWLLGFFDGYKHLPQISMEHCPQLSQPFHPSDIINRFLLNKKPDAEVAITHDSQWMDMMKD